MSGISPTVLTASYAGLIAVNAVYGRGIFGVRTNGEISAAYPTNVTPSGPTFAIWGPIFLLQGGGTVALASGGDAARMALVAGPWVATWLGECMWQGVFGVLPVPQEGSSAIRKLASLAPAAAILGAAHRQMLDAALALAGAPAGGLVGTLVVDFPTGLNAGWLAAATGIGMTLVAQQVPPLQSLASPEAGALLVGGLTAYGAAATISLAGSPATALGYAAATAWACRGIASESAKTLPVVKTTAALCAWVAVAAGAFALAWGPLKR